MRSNEKQKIKSPNLKERSHILNLDQIITYKRKSCVDIGNAETLIYNLKHKNKITKQYKEDYF